MAAASSFKSQECATILKEFETIYNSRPELGDIYSVADGELQIGAGGFSPLNIINGRYSPEAAAAHFEGLAERSFTFINGLNSDIVNDEGALDDLVNYRYKVRIVAKKIKLLHIRMCADYPSFAMRIDAVRDLFAKQVEIAERLIREEAPAGFNHPPEPIDFDESILSRATDFRIPEGATIADVLHLVKTLKTQRRSEAGKYASMAATMTIGGVGVVGAACVEPFKFALLNPFEYYFKGEVVTQSPVKTMLESTRQSLREITDGPDRLLLHQYACWFLNELIVTEEHVDAFCSLAKYFNSQYSPGGPIAGPYEIASSDPDELIEMTRDRIRNIICERMDPSLLGAEARKLIREQIASTSLKVVTPHDFFRYLFNDNYSKLLWVEDPLAIFGMSTEKFRAWKQDFTGENSLEERKRYFLETSNGFLEERVSKTYISLDLLLRVVDAVGSNPLCTEFKIPCGIISFPQLIERLEKYDFLNNPGGSEKLLFSRDK